MKIRELPLPVTTTKADWLPGTTWIGFTPTGTGGDADAKCQNTISKQMAGGLVLERVAQKMEDPRPGFENDPQVILDRETHRQLKARLIAIHELRPTSRPLKEVIGKDEYEHLQDVWAEPGKRKRWSVAFPIVRTWEIVGKPTAHSVLSPEVFRSTYQTQSSTLRIVSDQMRREIADLDAIEMPAKNAWIAIEDEIRIAELSNIDRKTATEIDIDLRGALEGETVERKAKIKRRAAWLAQKFWLFRQNGKSIRCDNCAFDPANQLDLKDLPARSLFDVHHKDPLAEGIRRTIIEDFALLCPRCHRIEHLRIRLKSKGN
jgi:5-methylcytosine-specific restriction enzyme A